MGLASLALAPPASGEMLLVPLTAGAAAALPRVATAGDLRIVGRGRLPGSLVVSGSRGALLGPASAAAILVLAASPAGCSLAREKRA